MRTWNELKSGWEFVIKVGTTCLLFSGVFGDHVTQVFFLYLTLLELLLVPESENNSVQHHGSDKLDIIKTHTKGSQTNLACMAAGSNSNSLGSSATSTPSLIGAPACQNKNRIVH